MSFWSFGLFASPKVFPKLKGTASILGGFTFMACSFNKTRPVVENPTPSKTLANSLTALEQAGQVGTKSTTSTSSCFMRLATSGPCCSINLVTSLKAPMNE